MNIFRFIIPHIIASLIITMAYCVFIAVFFIQYSQFTEQKMYTNIEEYEEIDIHHLCNVTGCNAIYYNNKYYGKDNATGIINIKYRTDVNIPEKLITHDNISIRKDLSFIIALYPENIDYPVFFSVGMAHFYDTFLVLYFILLTIVNVLLFFIVRVTLYKEKVLHDIESSKDKTKLQFDNLMFFIENLNHEVNTPMFILSRKIKEIKSHMDDKCDDETIKIMTKSFKIIYDTIDQINAVMQRTREVKRINKISEDRTIGDLVESTILTVKIMRAEDFVWEIDDRLKDYYLNQDLLGNGTFINILTNHVKNSIEAFSTRFTALLVEYNSNNNLLTFDFKDDGNGIPSELKKKVFNKGFTTKGEKDERGSGLSINKDIIESSGGKLILIDTTVGTTFRMSIPVKLTKGDEV